MVKKILSVLFIAATLGMFSSCSNLISNNEEYRTVPITNNPLIVPDTASPLPGFPSGTSSLR